MESLQRNCNAIRSDLIDGGYDNNLPIPAHELIHTINHVIDAYSPTKSMWYIAAHVTALCYAGVLTECGSGAYIMGDAS